MKTAKTYEGTNAVSQNFAVKPEKVWKEYVSDFANVAQVKDFETEMQVLQEQGLIRIIKKMSDHKTGCLQGKAG